MTNRSMISDDRVRDVLGITDSQPPVSCDWLEEAAKQIRAIARLTPGWDSHGSPPPDVRRLNAAWNLLLCLCHAPGLTKPHVNPTPDGGIQFDWEERDRYFQIVLVGERAATYLFRDDNAGFEETGEVFEGEPLNRLLDFVRRVASVAGTTPASPCRLQSILASERGVESPR